MLYIGYTGKDPTHGFQTKYLIVTKGEYRGGEEEQGQVIVYMSDEEMNQDIRKLENSSLTTKEVIDTIAQFPEHTLLRVPKKITIDFYKWQWFQWRLIHRWEQEFS